MTAAAVQGGDRGTATTSELDVRRAALQVADTGVVVQNINPAVAVRGVLHHRPLVSFVPDG